MAKKNKNNLYLIILAALVIIYILSKYVVNVEPESNFDMNILQLDTAQIASLNIQTNKGQKEAIKIYKEDGRWQVEQGSQQALADQQAVQELLKTLANLKIQNLVGTDKSKWKEQKLTDSLAIAVEVYNQDNKLIKDYYIGKFTYKQNDSPYPQRGRNNGIGLTYVRLASQPESFIVEGFLPMTFNRQFSSLRNHHLVKVDQSKIDKIDFNYPADTAFNIAKADSGVFLISQRDTVDSKKINSFLGKLANYRERQFDDSFNSASSPAIFSMNITGKLLNEVKLNVYEKDTANYVVTSSQFPKTNFVVKKSQLTKNIFKSKQSFIQ